MNNLAHEGIFRLLLLKIIEKNIQKMTKLGG